MRRFYSKVGFGYLCGFTNFYMGVACLAQYLRVPRNLARASESQNHTELQDVLVICAFGNGMVGIDALLRTKEQMVAGCWRRKPESELSARPMPMGIEGWRNKLRLESHREVRLDHILPDHDSRPPFPESVSVRHYAVPLSANSEIPAARSSIGSERATLKNVTSPRV